MKQNLSLVILTLLGLVALCVAQNGTTTAPEVTNTTTPSENTTLTEATPTAENTTLTEITPAADNTTAPANSTQIPPVEPTEDAGDPGLSDGAIAGIAIGSIAGVAAIGGGVFVILKKTGRM